jgi:regulator of sigma D
MLDNVESARERWGGVSSIIDRWLQERQDMLVIYCELSGEDPAKGDFGQKLQTLCQILVDYVSAGHFEVYDQLVKEARDFDDTEALKEAPALFDVVDATTEDVLDFNDKYQEVDDLTTISVDLSRLGEVLATRFEAEDRMIEVLHVAHKDQVTQ